VVWLGWCGIRTQASALLPCGLILAYDGLEEETLDQKSLVSPGWGLMQQASPMLIEKRKLLKFPSEILTIGRRKMWKHGTTC